MLPVASLMAGLSKRAVPTEALYPPALLSPKTTTPADASVMADVKNAMFMEGLRQIARKTAARQQANGATG